jgi:hypothetical protein
MRALYRYACSPESTPRHGACGKSRGAIPFKEPLISLLKVTKRTGFATKNRPFLLSEFTDKTTGWPSTLFYKNFILNTLRLLPGA